MRSALIWTGITEQINELQILSDAEFLQHAQLMFGHRLGRLLTVSKRHVYPLKMLYAEEQVKPGLVLLGNAAHTVHPIAAQGFNLGLGDVALLAQTIADAVRKGKNFAAKNFGKICRSTWSATKTNCAIYG